jgi:hypothetical protein
VPLGDPFPRVGEGDVELHDLMAVARNVGDAARALVPLDETGERCDVSSPTASAWSRRSRRASASSSSACAARSYSSSPARSSSRGSLV